MVLSLVDNSIRIEMSSCLVDIMSIGMEPDISSLAALISEPARGRILIALLDGRGLPASELAQRAGITCQTASSHLAKLAEGRLLQVVPQGRHRYYGSQTLGSLNCSSQWRGSLP
jgi:DNA-binding transcriptional ArsR family regulator